MNEEEIYDIYIPTWGIVVSMPKSEWFFYEFLKESEMDRSMYLSAETHMLKHGYTWTDRRKRGRKKRDSDDND
jgi:hypothetical protein